MGSDHSELTIFMVASVQFRVTIQIPKVSDATLGCLVPDQFNPQNINSNET
jgi:hypothetical protein